MLQVTVIIRLTGLLLLAPDSAKTGAQVGTFPLHVLFPVEGDSVPPHVAQLGWRSDKAACKYKYEGAAPQNGVCWVNMENWSLDIGKGGSPSTGVVLPPPGVLLSDATHHVQRQFFSDQPGRRIRSRVSLYSGRVVDLCPLGKWHFAATDSVLLTNVVTWELQIPNMVALTRTELDYPVGTTPLRSTIDGPQPSNTDSLELFIRHIPAEEVNSKPPVPRINDRGFHLHAFYDLLGIPQGSNRDIPVLQRSLGSCKFNRSPGSPTCMVAGGLPPP